MFYCLLIFVFQTLLPDVDGDTSNKPSVVQDDDHKLFYTDTEVFQGPMTQLMKATFQSSTDRCTEFMQVDTNSRCDFFSLPNLNAAFSEFELTPHEVSIYLQYYQIYLVLYYIVLLVLRLFCFSFCNFFRIQRMGLNWNLQPLVHNNNRLRT